MLQEKWEYLKLCCFPLPLLSFSLSNTNALLAESPFNVQVGIVSLWLSTEVFCVVA